MFENRMKSSLVTLQASSSQEKIVDATFFTHIASVVAPSENEKKSYWEKRLRVIDIPSVKPTKSAKIMPKDPRCLKRRREEFAHQWIAGFLNTNSSRRPDVSDSRKKISLTLRKTVDKPMPSKNRVDDNASNLSSIPDIVISDDEIVIELDRSNVDKDRKPVESARCKTRKIFNAIDKKREDNHHDKLREEKENSVSEVSRVPELTDEHVGAEAANLSTIPRKSITFNINSVKTPATKRNFQQTNTEIRIADSSVADDEPLLHRSSSREDLRRKNEAEPALSKKPKIVDDVTFLEGPYFSSLKNFHFRNTSTEVMKQPEEKIFQTKRKADAFRLSNFVKKIKRRPSKPRIEARKKSRLRAQFRNLFGEDRTSSEIDEEDEIFEQNFIRMRRKKARKSSKRVFNRTRSNFRNYFDIEKQKFKSKRKKLEEEQASSTLEEIVVIQDDVKVCSSSNITTEIFPDSSTNAEEVSLIQVDLTIGDFDTQNLKMKDAKLEIIQLDSSNDESEDVPSKLEVPISTAKSELMEISSPETGETVVPEEMMSISSDASTIEDIEDFKAVKDNQEESNTILKPKILNESNNRTVNITDKENTEDIPSTEENSLRLSTENSENAKIATKDVGCTIPSTESPSESSLNTPEINDQEREQSVPLLPETDSTRSSSGEIKDAKTNFDNLSLRKLLDNFLSKNCSITARGNAISIRENVENTSSQNEILSGCAKNFSVDHSLDSLFSRIDQNESSHENETKEKIVTVPNKEKNPKGENCKESSIAGLPQREMVSSVAENTEKVCEDGREKAFSTSSPPVPFIRVLQPSELGARWCPTPVSNSQLQMPVNLSTCVASTIDENVVPPKKRKSNWNSRTSNNSHTSQNIPYNTLYQQGVQYSLPNSQGSHTGPQYIQPSSQYQPRLQFPWPSHQIFPSTLQNSQPSPQYSQPSPQHSQSSPQYSQPNPQRSQSSPQYPQPNLQYSRSTLQYAQIPRSSTRRSNSIESRSNNLPDCPQSVHFSINTVLRSIIELVFMLKNCIEQYKIAPSEQDVQMLQLMFVARKKLLDEELIRYAYFGRIKNISQIISNITMFYESGCLPENRLLDNSQIEMIVNLKELPPRLSVIQQSINTSRFNQQSTFQPRPSPPPYNTVRPSPVARNSFYTSNQRFPHNPSQRILPENQGSNNPALRTQYKSPLTHVQLRLLNQQMFLHQHLISVTQRLFPQETKAYNQTLIAEGRANEIFLRTPINTKGERIPQQISVENRIFGNGSPNNTSRISSTATSMSCNQNETQNTILISTESSAENNLCNQNETQNTTRISTETSAENSPCNQDETQNNTVLISTESSAENNSCNQNETQNTTRISTETSAENNSCNQNETQNTTRISTETSAENNPCNQNVSQNGVIRVSGQILIDNDPHNRSESRDSVIRVSGQILTDDNSCNKSQNSVPSMSTRETSTESIHRNNENDSGNVETNQTAIEGDILQVMSIKDALDTMIELCAKEGSSSKQDSTKRKSNSSCSSTISNNSTSIPFQYSTESTSVENTAFPFKTASIEIKKSKETEECNSKITEERSIEKIEEVSEVVLDNCNTNIVTQEKAMQNLARIQFNILDVKTISNELFNTISKTNEDSIIEKMKETTETEDKNSEEFPFKIERTVCIRCTKPSSVVCERCFDALYCSPECHELHWKEHHYRTCKPLSPDILSSLGLNSV